MFLLLKYPSPPPPQIVELSSVFRAVCSFPLYKLSSPLRFFDNSLISFGGGVHLDCQLLGQFPLILVKGSSFSDSAVCRRAVLVTSLTSPFQRLCSSPQVSNQAREASITPKLAKPPRETPLFSRQPPTAQVRKQLKESSARIDGLRDLHREWQGHGAGPGRDTASFGGKSPATAYKRCCKL